ncbi:MAG: PQQ-binding-like beta-propeller repeat protein [Phycisphaerales bacterium]
MPFTSSQKHTSCLAACAACAAFGLAASVAAPSWGQATGDTSAPAAPAPAKTARQILDERYVIGPTASDEFGYRIAWQTEPLATKGSQTAVCCVDADSIWYGDEAGSVVRVRRENGESIWRASTYKGLEHLLSIDHLPLGQSDHVYVVTDIYCVALDALTGSLVRRTVFGQLPSSPPVAFGPYFICGTRTGLIAWFQYGAGYAWRATTIGGSVASSPTMEGGVVLAASSKGVVLAMDASSTHVIWDRKLSSPVSARIAADHLAAFVAGQDQTLWAFDMQRGRVLWHYFTQTPLLNDPVRMADGLYLQIPGEGLVSFNPHPTDKPDGEVLWKSTAPGNVVGRLGPNLLVWDHPSRTLSFVANDTGRIVSQAALPQVEVLNVVPPVNGDLYVAGKDGRVEHLEPLARPSVPGMPPAGAAMAAPAQPAPAPAAAPANGGGDAPAAAPPATAPNAAIPSAQQPKLNPRLR